MHLIRISSPPHPQHILHCAQFYWKALLQIRHRLPLKIKTNPELVAVTTECVTEDINLGNCSTWLENPLTVGPWTSVSFWSQCWFHVEMSEVWFLQAQTTHMSYRCKWNHSSVQSFLQVPHIATWFGNAKAVVLKLFTPSSTSVYLTFQLPPSLDQV